MFGDLLFPLRPLPPQNPHWLKALSRGRAWKHAPSFSSFDWRKRKVWLAAAAQWLDVLKKRWCLSEVERNSTVNHRLTPPEWNPWDAGSERGFHRLHHEQMIGSELDYIFRLKNRFNNVAIGQLNHHRIYLNAPFLAIFLDISDAFTLQTMDQLVTVFQRWV